MDTEGQPASTEKQAGSGNSFFSLIVSASCIVGCSRLFGALGYVLAIPLIILIHKFTAHLFGKRPPLGGWPEEGEEERGKNDPALHGPYVPTASK